MHSTFMVHPLHEASQGGVMVFGCSAIVLMTG